MKPVIAIPLTIIMGLLPLRLASADDVDYLRQVKPLLEKRCTACHGGLQQKGGLRLDTAEFAKRGGDTGTILTPGEPDKSLLIRAVLRTGDLKMPPEGEGAPLTPDEIRLLQRWIETGAIGPADERPQADPREWWSYRPVVRATIPVVRSPEWSRTPVDAFLASRHEQLQLTPAAVTDRATWLRRVTLDLTGLPPTRTELHQFLNDPSTEAFERVVDDLLQRPQYGERWGRHWMDVWRYSDWYGSRGINEIRYSQRHIWRWRDWIVDSLNTDKPYDQMIIEMLAADEVAPTDPQTLAATGFIGRNWYKFDRNVWMFDVVEHTGQAFLGLTLKCARCHDHKFDPITQEEYYRFRAFFEPHDVRTDRLSAAVGTEKDATLGDVLKEGVARVYDKQSDVKTYLFQRGDNRYPDESRPLVPGVPAALRETLPEIQVVPLPAESYYPALHPQIAQGLIDQAQTLVNDLNAQIVAAVSKRTDAMRQLAERDQSPPANQDDAAATRFRDDFSRPRPDDWQIVSGDWVYENGRLVEKAVTSFATIVSKRTHPRDFTARLRYRPLSAAGLRSIGFSFDYLDQGNSQDIYTHTGDASQTVQAFHRTGGQQVYPPAAIVRTTDLKVNEEAVIELHVRGTQLSILLNGARRLDYVMPVPRRDGKFALWVHNGSAEFLELEIRELRADREALRRAVMSANQAVELLEYRLVTAKAQVESLRCRIAAERAKYVTGAANDPSSTAKDELKHLALAAWRAEHEVAVAKASETLLQAEQHRLSLRPLAREDGAADSLIPENAVSPAIIEADAKLAAAKLGLDAVRAQGVPSDAKYSPIGEVFPATSSGRRTALARWIASRHNPRTARVAVNHIWMRHFGQPLVASVANFGLNGDQPSHPELLDWLTAELMENGWRMKPIHRMLVLSRAYRCSSAMAPTDPAERQRMQANSKIDPTNKHLWRMNSRRMEAEVVRDSVLFTAGSLDMNRGGPEIAESQGLTSLRRSLYFRNTPNEKMKFLEIFDVADPNGCYRRRESVVPHQALALMNSALALDQSRLLAERISKDVGEQNNERTQVAFITAAFETILNQSPTAAELQASQRFLADHPQQLTTAAVAFPAGGQSQRGPSATPHLRARENLVHVLFSHNAFVTIR